MMIRTNRTWLTPRAAAMIGWAGLALVVASAAYLPAGYPFPGIVALAPTLGTAAVIVAGSRAATTRGTVALLGLRPFVFIGAISYSLYLWHWPLLVVLEARYGSLGLPTSTAIVLFAVVPATLTYYFFESPARSWRWATPTRRGLALGAACMLVAAAAAVVLQWSVPQGEQISEAAESELAAIEQSLDSLAPSSTLNVTGASTTVADGSAASAPVGSILPAPTTTVAPPTTPGIGALSLDEPAEQLAFEQPASVESITPDPLAPPDVSELQRCRLSIAQSELASDCTVGTVDGQRTMALVGDSKAAQWVSAFETIASAKGWRLQIYSKAACTFAGVTLVQDGPPYEACSDWNEAVMAQLLDERPDVVIVTGRDQPVVSDGAPLSTEASTQLLIDGHVARWGELEANGMRVIVLAETPTPRSNVAECLSEHTDHLEACTFPRADALDPDGGSMRSAYAQMGTIDYVDVNAAICPTETCPVVVGGVIVYRVPTHLTDTYVRTMTPYVAAAFDAIGAF